MTYAAKNLINAVKKALDKKASFPAGYNAYANSNGDLIARDIRDCNTDITVFVAGIVEDVAKREKIYSIDALTLAADTGIFAGGAETPENFTEYYETPAENFREVVTISADDLKAAAYSLSKDNSRPILTGIHLATAGYIETCDGFRAYRKKINPLNIESLHDSKIADGKPTEAANGLMIQGRAAAYGLKGNITVYNGEKYIKLEDETGIILYCRKYTEQPYISMETIYNPTAARERERAAIITIKDTKALKGVLKTACSAKVDRRRGELTIRVHNGKLQYHIRALNIIGEIDAATENDTPEGWYYTLNPAFLMDAVINQGGNTLELPASYQAPAFCANGDTRALVLPIRNAENPFEEYDREEAEKAAEKEREALARLNEKQHQENRFVNITAEDVKKEVAAAEEVNQEAPATDPETETAATVEKLEIVPREEKPAAPVEVIPPEIVKAREIYKKLLACNFRPTKLQEGEADIIYNAYREKLQPIARKAGGLYIDTLSIIAAVMAIYEELEKEGI